MSPNKHQLRGPGEKYVSALEKARKLEEGIVSESTLKVRKVKTDERDSDFECYDKSYRKPVHVDVDKETTGSSQRETTLALLEEEKISTTTVTQVLRMVIGIVILAYASNRKFKLPKRLGSVPYSEPMITYTLIT